MKKNVLAVFLFLFCVAVNAQDTVLQNLITQTSSSFAPSGNSFKGEGWHKIDSAIKSTSNVLIGEDHFFNEVPFFTSAVARQVQFDNFCIEIDPYSAALLQNKLRTFSNEQFDQYKNTFGNTFSFFALQKEMNLLQQMVQSKATIMGTDQIMLVADRLLCSELKKITKSSKAKKMYEKIELNSKTYFDSFLVNQSKPFYMLTPDFEDDLNKLLSMNLSPEETSQLKDIQISRKIYMEQSHLMRLQLMKNNFYRFYYQQLQGKKNLFKFGAVHMCKSEGLLGGYDIGNLVYNIADSKYEKSVHIMIVGKNGMQGSPFKGSKAQPLDPVNGDLKSLAPFLNEVKTKEWHCFDLAPLQKAIRKEKLSISDKFLQRVVQGYDFLVVIPEVTADTFEP